MTRRLSILALVAFSMVAMATVASAAHFAAPEYITADENGHFVTSMRIFAGDSEITIDAEFLIGMENCDEDRRRERECGVVIAPGENYYFIYEGNLIDPLFDGSVIVGVDFCDDVEGMAATIEVRNFNTVATDSGSWDTLKAQYR